MSFLDFEYQQPKLSNYPDSASSQGNQQVELAKTWNLQFGYFQKNRMSSILCLIQEAIVEQANLGANQNQKIPHTILHINFPYLKILNLQTNHIKSIEFLEFLKVYELEQLNLKNNQISNVRVLKKLKWIKIRSINVQNNSIFDIGSVTCSQFKCLQNLQLQNSNDQKISENLTPLTRMNSLQLKELNCSSKNRIIDNFVLVQMKQKYKNRRELPLQNHQNNQNGINQNIHNLKQLKIIQKKRYF